MPPILQQQEDYRCLLPKKALCLPHATTVGARPIGMLAVFWPLGEARTQGMQQIPVGNAKQGAMASDTGTVTAVNAAGRNVTFDHGPIPEIKWPAMKMEFPVAPFVDPSKVKTGDEVRFTVSGSGSSYTVQSIGPSQ